MSPNDHVNCGQSSNDIIPTTIHASAAIALNERLLDPEKLTAGGLWPTPGGAFRSLQEVGEWRPGSSPWKRASDAADDPQGLVISLVLASGAGRCWSALRPAWRGGFCLMRVLDTALA